MVKSCEMQGVMIITVIMIFNSSYLLTPKFTYTIVILECHKSPLYIYGFIVVVFVQGPKGPKETTFAFSISILFT